MSRPWETYKAGRTVKLRRRPVRHHATSTSATNPPPTVTEATPIVVATEIGEADTETATDYGTLRKAELQSLAEENGLDTSGTRSELIARLESGA